MRFSLRSIYVYISKMNLNVIMYIIYMNMDKYLIDYIISCQVAGMVWM